MANISINSFFDEMEKISIRVKGLHGSSGRWSLLRSSREVGGKIGGLRDPNQEALYAAIRKRSLVPHVETMAHRATKARGGSPVVADLIIDTKKGREPHELTSWARKKGITKDDVLDMIDDLDSGQPTKWERGKLWERLNRSIGAWFTQTPVKPVKWRDVANPRPAHMRQVSG